MRASKGPIKALPNVAAATDHGGAWSIEEISMDKTKPEVAADDNMPMLDWAEQSAMQHLRDHLSDIDAIKRETVLTLSVLFAAAAGCIGYVSQHSEGKGLSALDIGALAAAAWLYAACIALSILCLKVKDAPSQSNRGLALLQESYSLAAVKRVEIGNIDGRSEQAAQRAIRDSNWLNRIRLGALAVPLVFLVSYLCSSSPSCVEAVAGRPALPAAGAPVNHLPHPAKIPTPGSASSGLPLAPAAPAAR